MGRKEEEKRCGEKWRMGRSAEERRGRWEDGGEPGTPTRQSDLGTVPGHFELQLCLGLRRAQRSLQLALEFQGQRGRGVRSQLREPCSLWRTPPCADPSRRAVKLPSRVEQRCHLGTRDQSGSGALAPSP